MHKTWIVAAVLVVAAPAAAQQPQYTPEQLMKAWDKDGDGVLTKAEWTGAGRREQGFDFSDANHDGKLTLDELKAAMARAQQQRPGG